MSRQRSTQHLWSIDAFRCLCTKVHIILRHCRGRIAVSNAVSGYLYRVTLRRHLMLPYLSREIVETMKGSFFGFCGPKLAKFWDNAGDPYCF